MSTDDIKQQYYALRNKKQESGFEPMPKSDNYFRPNCGDFSHCPPGHLHVPAGMRYRHVCPICGMITYINSSEVIC